MALNWDTGAGHVLAGGKSLEWAAFGQRKDNAPVIVLLHEGLGCVALWRDFPQALATATGLPVFAYSRAGYGQSDAATLPRPLDYMTREALDVLPEILDAVGADKVILMGHSDGATIAAEYAGRVQDFRVRGLVLMAPHFFTEPHGLAEIAKAREAFTEGDLAGRMSAYHPDANETFFGWNDAWLNPDFRDWNVAEVIDYLRVPTLVIQGKQDQYGTVAQVEEVHSRCYAPVDVLLLDNCRHAPHLGQPGQVLGAVQDFTGRLQRIEMAMVAVA